MKVEFLEVAENELFDAVVYYNEESEGLGFDFAAEVKRTIGRIIEYPEAWALLSCRTRRCRTNRFPYGLIYQIRGETILIVAVMHLHKDPVNWENRISTKAR